MAGIASRAAKATICWRRLEKKRIAADIKRVGAPLPHRGERDVDFARCAGVEKQHLPAEAARGLQRVGWDARAFRNFWIGEHGNQRSIGNEFVKQAEPLTGDQSGEPAHAGDITAGPIEATYVALVNRIAASREHNRNGLGRRHGSQYRSAASGRSDHVELAADQIGRKGRQSIVLVFCKTVFDRRVAGLDIAGFTQAASERGEEVGRVILAERVQEADHRHRWLLRVCRERPRGCRAAE